ncbi:MAG: hypothetical protein LBT25_09495 [Candidatus Symbiothrix sp.]|jgi:antitoxin component YwqK of YwqJK toxin-antitoxin module|nr:hypothetical protein [Candidatus Symbiothrix sp.]
MKNSLYIISLICLISCNINNKETSQDLPTEDECMSDSSIYLLLTYYPEGGIRREGYIQNMQRVEEWVEWYADGVMKRKLYFVNNEIFLDKMRESPEIDFADDTLKIGVSTKMRIRWLHPSEQLGYSKNLIIKELEDDMNYDYEIMPIEGDYANFFYTKLFLENGKFIARATPLESVPIFP